MNNQLRKESLKGDDFLSEVISIFCALQSIIVVEYS